MLNFSGLIKGESNFYCVKISSLEIWRWKLFDLPDADCNDPAVNNYTTMK